MTNTNTFFKAFSSEQYKLSKNKEIFGILLLPVLIVFAVDLYIAYDVLSAGSDASNGTSNPWKMMLGKTVFMFYYLLFPILVALFVHACCDVEYRNNNYKILFTLPVSKARIFFSKALFIQITVLFSVLFSYLAFLMSGYFLGIAFPELGFQNYDFREVIFYVFLKLFITLSAIAMVQFTLSLIFKNFIYPIGAGVFLLLFSTIIHEKKFSDFLIYTGGYKSLDNLIIENTAFERLDYSNIAAIFLLMAVSFYLFIKKKGG